MSIIGIAEINGAKIAYEVTGNGVPLVLIHAGIADRRLWNHQVEVFAQTYQVIRYDLRGFGESNFPDGDYSHYQDLRGLLDHLQIAQAHLCGVSMGGSTAIDFTLTSPERVKSLIVVGSSASGFTPTRSPEEIAKADAFGAQWDALFEAGKLEEANELELQLWVDGPRDPAQVHKEVRSLVGDMNLKAMRMYNANTNFKRLEPPAFERLAEIEVPTLLIVGSLDTLNTQQSINQLAANIRGVKKVVMEGLTHVPNLERPEEFNRIVLDFLASV
jgi:pimeloyl-ACP methyl ester carboxylesterase